MANLRWAATPVAPGDTDSNRGACHGPMRRGDEIGTGTFAVGGAGRVDRPYRLRMATCGPRWWRSGSPATFEIEGRHAHDHRTDQLCQPCEEGEAPAQDFRGRGGASEPDLAGGLQQ